MHCKLVNELSKLFAKAEYLSPLFAKLALEHIEDDDIGSVDQEAIVDAYITDVTQPASILCLPDTFRAISCVAYTATLDSGAPREVSIERARGALEMLAKRDGIPFVAQDGENVIPSLRIIEELTRSAIIHDSAGKRFIQFTYDPVAEIMANRATLSNQRQSF